MDPLPLLSCPDSLLLLLFLLVPPRALIFSLPLLWSRLSAQLATTSTWIPHFLFEGGEPQTVTQTVTRCCNLCSNFTRGQRGLASRGDISFHLLSAYLTCTSVTCLSSPGPPLSTTPRSFSRSVFCVNTHVRVRVCLSRGFPDDLVHCGRGVIKDQGQRPFPFPWEDEWPCLKVAAYGLRAIRVCCEPATLSALCTKAGPWEKRNTRHITRSAETNIARWRWTN